MICKKMNWHLFPTEYICRRTSEGIELETAFFDIMGNKTLAEYFADVCICRRNSHPSTVLVAGCIDAWNTAKIKSLC